jgi:outer membrane lipoprotein-sorting protein
MSRLLALLAATALAACAPRAPPPDLSLDPAELLAQVRAAQARLTSVRGEVRARVEAPDGSGTVPAFVAAERPDRLYVQTLDFFGNPAAVLAASGGALSLYDARERVLYRGPATAENLARLVPVPLSPADLATLLCGTAPLLDGVPVRAEPGRGHVTLEIDAGDRTQVLRVGPGAAVLRSAVRARGGSGARSWQVELVPADATAFPRTPPEIELSAEAPHVRVQISWVDAERNVALEPGIFSPAAPRGARVVDLAGAPPLAPLAPRAGAE